MTPSPLPAQYDAAATEREVARRWQEANAFAAEDSGSRRAGGTHDPFVIFMPPPNVTAVLHVGHGLTMTVLYRSDSSVRSCPATGSAVPASTGTV